MERETLPNIPKPLMRNVRSSDTTPILSESLLIYLSYVLVFVTFPLSVWFCLETVAHYQRIVIFRLGRLREGGVRGPGLIFLLPCVDEYIKVDLRTQSFDVHPQEVLTRDSVTIQIDAVVYYAIRNPLDSVIQIRNVNESTKLLAQTTLRNVVGTKNLMELLTAKESLSRTIEMILDEATGHWGVKVERVEIKDVRLPLAMQRAMAAEAEALREAKAKIVAAEGELNASKSLKEASDIMSTNPITLKLRYLQTMSSIANEHRSTIIFPFPIEFLTLAAGHEPVNETQKHKQIQLPTPMQKAMAIEREAEREAKAKIVAAKGELEASKNLSEASDVMSKNPIALQLRYLQTLNTISNENNHTIVFPFPMELLRKMFGQFYSGGLEDNCTTGPQGCLCSAQINRKIQTKPEKHDVGI